MLTIRSILLSFTFHLLLILGLLWILPEFIAREPEVVEFEWTPEQQIADALKVKDKTIVRQVELPEKLQLKEDETLARFLSEKKQRVKEETQAAITGMTKNRSNSEQTVPTPDNDSKSPTAEKTPQENKKTESDDGYRQVDISQQLNELKSFNDGFSSVGEALPQNVRVGSFTALNTDRYLYYTFYARVEELVRYRWESRIQKAINSFDPNLRMQLADRNWITHAEFFLDKKGNLVRAVMMKSSGVRLFDNAATEAFLDAKIFPNPPLEMANEDGLIKLVFSFTVRYQANRF